MTGEVRRPSSQRRSRPRIIGVVCLRLELPDEGTGQFSIGNLVNAETGDNKFGMPGSLMLLFQQDCDHRVASQQDRRHTDNLEVSLIQLKDARSEEHTSELQSLMRSSYAVFCLKKKKSK